MSFTYHVNVRVLAISVAEEPSLSEIILTVTVKLVLRIKTCHQWKLCRR